MALCEHGASSDDDQPCDVNGCKLATKPVLCDNTAHEKLEAGEECTSHADEDACRESGDHDAVPEAAWSIEPDTDDPDFEGTTYHCDPHAEEMKGLLESEGIEYTISKVK